MATDGETGLIVIPERFIATTIRREGEAGRRWLAALPALIAAQCHRWDLVIDGPPWHGYLAVVLPVRQGAVRAALKIAWPDGALRAEATALAAWAGDGAVQLLRADLEASALLLERLDPDQTLMRLPIDTALGIAGDLLRRLAIPAPPDVPPLPSLANELAASLPPLWERYGRPLPEPLLERSMALARSLGATPSRQLVNYDLHYDNVLAGRRAPWLAIDPKAVAGVPEFGLAQLLWCRLEEIEAAGGVERALTILCQAATLDLALARAWTVVRCVEYWLWGLSVGFTEDPARCRRIVAALLPTLDD